MDRSFTRFQHFPNPSEQRPSTAISLIYSLAILYLLLLYFNRSLPAPQTLFLDTLVYITPQRLLLHRAHRQELAAKGMLYHTHAAKKEALRGMLGLGGATLLSKLPSGASDGIAVMRRASTSVFSRSQADSDVPAGLGNWDNSCYQNVVLQGLASLDSMRSYLGRLHGEEESTNGSLLETINKLNDPVNNGQQLWTPAKLKNMSSWQQQDAQEYYSKILDEIEKEAAQAFSTANGSKQPGLEGLVQPDQAGPSDHAEAVVSVADTRSPLDGLLAQKVTCTRCGFSEGLSMIPMNCLTLPLPLRTSATSISDSLDEYTKLEEITEVECAKCTLVHAEKSLTKMLPSNPCFRSTDSDAVPDVDSKVLELPPELRAQAFKRLAAIQKALEDDDFTDKTLEEKCEIGKKARQSSTKSKQAVVARPPQCLVVHVNRSVFEETTGIQRKNYARVQYPLVLDLAPWMLAEPESNGENDAHSVLYSLRAVVTHYGRHENGHYIAYRQHPGRRKGAAAEEGEADADEAADTVQKRKDPWYRLSDEEVDAVEEDDVLNQGGVFMLFYEREKELEALPLPQSDPVPTTESMNLSPTTARDEAVSRAVEAEDSPPTLRNDEDKEDSKATASIATDELPSNTSIPPEQPSTEPTTEDEAELTPSKEEQTPREPSPPSPLRMRTARIPVVENDFSGNTFRAVAAT